MLADQLSKRVKEYENRGYVIVRDLFSDEELDVIEPIMLKSHQAWLSVNSHSYSENIINSEGLTHSDFLSPEERLALFQFIADDRLVELLEGIVSGPVFFGNTQLFFNPVSTQQKNYWHRDIQYGDFSVDLQKQILIEQMLLHFRLPLRDEIGLQLIPKTHQRWDTEEEYNVRMGQSGCSVSDDLPEAKTIQLERGDLLVFSAGMIHRGLYSPQRLTFDICCGGYSPQFSHMTDVACLPDRALFNNISNPLMYKNAIEKVTAV